MFTSCDAGTSTEITQLVVIVWRATVRTVFSGFLASKTKLLRLGANHADNLGKSDNYLKDK